MLNPSAAVYACGLSIENIREKLMHLYEVLPEDEIGDFFDPIEDLLDILEVVKKKIETLSDGLPGPRGNRHARRRFR